MPRFLSVCVCLMLLVLSAGPVWAGATPAPADILARFQPDGVLIVEYRFDRPVEKLVFAYGAASFRQRRWQVTDNLAAWNDQGELIGHNGPMDHVTLRIIPGWDRTDRIFSDLIPMGQGAGMLYPAWLVPMETALARSVRLEAAPGLSLLDRNHHWASAIQWLATDIEARALYAWLHTGPEKPLRADGLTLIAGSGLPADQVETVARAANAALARYTALLEQGPPDQPVLLLTGRADERTATNGSVGPGGLISLMLRWDAAGLPPDRVGRTVWHEMFHLWNRQTRSGSHPWLHEGAAEVAALLRHGDDAVVARAALAEALSDCLALLPPGEGVDGPTARRGQGPYRCGLALNLIIAAGLATDGDWAAGFGRLWRHLLAVPGGYGPEDALALARRQAPAAMPALDRLLAGGGGTGDLPALLASLGIRLEPAAPSADMLRDRLAQHLLALNCGPGLRGFYRQPDGLRFDGSHAACGPLATDPLVTRVEGFDLMQAAPAAFQAASTRCATGQPVRMEGPAGPLSVPCPRSITTPPSRFVVAGK